MLLAVNGHMADLKKEEGGRQDVLEVLPMQLLFGESRGVEGWEVHPVELLIGESSQVVPYGGRRGREGVGGRGKRVDERWGSYQLSCFGQCMTSSAVPITSQGLGLTKQQLHGRTFSM